MSKTRDVAIVSIKWTTDTLVCFNGFKEGLEASCPKTMRRNDSDEVPDHIRSGFDVFEWPPGRQWVDPELVCWRPAGNTRCHHSPPGSPAPTPVLQLHPALLEITYLPTVMQGFISLMHCGTHRWVDGWWVDGWLLKMFASPHQWWETYLRSTNELAQWEDCLTPPSYFWGWKTRSRCQHPLQNWWNIQKGPCPSPPCCHPGAPAWAPGKDKVKRAPLVMISAWALG